MRFAIIAAGEGSRLAEEGVAVPKPLVPIGGVPMLERLVRIFERQEAEEICLIVNRLHPETEAFARQLALTTSCPLRILVETTPSSMHSFAVLAPYLDGTPFCLTTVDTIFREDEFHKYIEAFMAEAPDALMAVTHYIDDEKPLYVQTDAAMRVLAFADTEPLGNVFASGGIYCMQPVVLKTLVRCMKEGRERMRNFQRALLEDHLDVRAYSLSKILDVDHVGDIAKAEAFLRTSAETVIP